MQKNQFLAHDSVGHQLNVCLSKVQSHTCTDVDDLFKTQK